MLSHGPPRVHFTRPRFDQRLLVAAQPTYRLFVCMREKPQFAGCF
mgnify:CR=1 FL=1